MLNTKTKITKRSIFRLSWTTSPDNLGYGKPDSTWVERKYHVDVTGTLKTLRDKWKIRQRKCGLTGGMYFAFYILGPDGKEYSFADLDEFRYNFYGDI